MDPPVYPPRGPENWVLSVCRACPGGCGIRARRIGGRVLGYWAAFLWAVAPFASIPLFVDRYQERFGEQFLPQALGLTAMSDYPSMVLVLASAVFVARSLEAQRLHDAVLAGLLLGAAMDMVWPLAIKRIIDGLAEPGVAADKLGRLTLYGGGVLALLVVKTLVETFRGYRTTVLNAKVIFRLRKRLFRRLIGLSLGELSEMKSGGITSRLAGDVDAVSGLIQMALISPGVALIRVILTVGILFALSWRLAIAGQDVVRREVRSDPRRQLAGMHADVVIQPCREPRIDVAGVLPEGVERSPCAGVPPARVGIAVRAAGPIDERRTTTPPSCVSTTTSRPSTFAIITHVATLAASMNAPRTSAVAKDKNSPRVLWVVNPTNASRISATTAM